MLPSFVVCRRARHGRRAHCALSRPKSLFLRLRCRTERSAVRSPEAHFSSPNRSQLEKYKNTVCVRHVKAQIGRFRRAPKNVKIGPLGTRRSSAPVPIESASASACFGMPCTQLCGCTRRGRTEAARARRSELVPAFAGKRSPDLLSRSPKRPDPEIKKKKVICVRHFER